MRKVAESTIRRLSLYLRLLEEFEGQGIETVSSGALAGRGGTTSAQVRKDLSFFGSFGKRGLGYPVLELVSHLRGILGLDRRYRVAMVGAGKIGSALVQYRGFRQRGFDIVAIFDVDPAKVGKAWNGLTVRHIDSLEAVAREERIDMAVVAPARGRPAPGRPPGGARHQGDPQLRAGADRGAGRRGGEDGEPRARAGDAELRADEPLGSSRAQRGTCSSAVR